jgi:competence protein ComFC
MDALASVLAPAQCRVCGQRSLLRASRIPICDFCLGGFSRIEPPFCTVCGRPFVSTLLPPNPLCRLCRGNFYAFDSARSFAIYDGPLVNAIMLLKYEEVTSLGVWFADRLVESSAKVLEQWEPNLIVPVPLFRDRLRERGYNQVELIARPLAKRLQIKLLAKALVRVKPRPPQLLLSRAERWTIVRGAYATNPAVSVDKSRILLLDDVMTTGATLNACAGGLKKAGAAAVLGLTVARMVPGFQAPVNPVFTGVEETKRI